MAKTPDERYTTAADFALALHTGTTPVAVPYAPPRPRRGLMVAALALVVLALAAGALLWRRFHGGGPASPSAIAVLPFTVRGNDTLQLGEGMVTLLSTKLDGAGDLRTVDARALLSYLEREKIGTMNVEEARRVAGRFSAGMFVLGDVVILGNRVQLSAGVYDRDKDGIPEQASVEGSIDTVFGLVDALAAKLLAERSGPSGRRWTGWRASPRHRCPHSRPISTASATCAPGISTGPPSTISARSPPTPDSPWRGTAWESRRCGWSRMT
jgi:hypothetical protein